MKDENFTIKEIELKLKKYCSYQDRCHFEVENKLTNLEIDRMEAYTSIFSALAS